MDKSHHLNEEQRDVVHHRGSPLLVLAAAGTGKTQALTARIAHIVKSDDVPPDRVLALTFTRRAAAEMRRRAAHACGCAERDLCHVGTFHSICMNLLRRYGNYLPSPLSAGFTVLDPTAALKVMEKHGVPQARAVVGIAANDDRVTADTMLRAVETWRNRALDPEQAQQEVNSSSVTASLPTRAASVAYRLYRQACARMDAVDFGDLIMHTVTMLERRPCVRAECQARLFAHMLVDEFQDTNPAQMKLVELLCRQDSAVDAHIAALPPVDYEEGKEEEEDDQGRFVIRRGGKLCEERLMVVGDDYQAIHEWRGATVKNIMDFGRKFPGARVVHMELNYRSLPHILDAAGRLISRNQEQHHKQLRCGRLCPSQNRNDHDDKSPSLLIDTEVRDVWEEAHRVVSEISRSGRNPGDFAVLYRINAQSQPFEQELKTAGIPYELKGASSFFARAEIKDCMAYARCVLNPRSDADFVRIVNNPARRVGKAVVTRLEEKAQRLGGGLWDAAFLEAEQEQDDKKKDRKSRKHEHLAEFVRLISSFRHACDEEGKAGTILEAILEKSGYLPLLRMKAERHRDATTRADADARLTNVHALLQLAHKIAASTASSLRAFVDRCTHDHGEEMLGDEEENNGRETHRGEIHDKRSEKVVLMTLHSSKGLEFPFVFITGMYEEMFPYYKCIREGKVEEERRLCYVGVTRAQEELLITVPRFREHFGKVVRTEPSRFISELVDDDNDEKRIST